MYKLKLHGFNNLTKSLSFCIYNFCFIRTQKHKKDYIAYISKKYNANQLSRILVKMCSIIDANILNIMHQDYEPQGASVTVLISENSKIKKNLINDFSSNSLVSKKTLAHLDKSHICIHTYPEIHPNNEFCTFRADIEISTCGIISPLKSLNYLLSTIKSDIITIDYKVRGFTRDTFGKKYFIDHNIYSIQDFISYKIKNLYQIKDFNFYEEKIFFTKMIIKKIQLKNYLFGSKIEEYKSAESEKISNSLKKEMQEIFNGENFPKNPY